MVGISPNQCNLILSSPNYLPDTMRLLCQPDQRLVGQSKYMVIWFLYFQSVQHLHLQCSTYSTFMDTPSSFFFFLLKVISNTPFLYVDLALFGSTASANSVS